MKITDVKIRVLVGIDEHPGGMIYDNKKVQRVAPTDIHPEYHKKKGHISVTHVPQPDGTFKITHYFLIIETDANIEGVSAFIRSLNRSDLALQLMPYHRMGLSKYAALDKPYELEEIQVMKAEEVETVRKKYEELGVSCTVSK